MLSDKNLLVLQSAANQSRGLAIDAIAKAKSGHLGLPLGCAEIGAALFGECMNFNHKDHRWANRDRFVLSAGHGSMFLYSWLHLAGYDISLDDIKNFRQNESKTPGHPEFGLTAGVECTTGPLGQGIANAVGMAVSSKMLAAKFNTANHKIFSNQVVCLCGDGCLQEGISSEACSLAGHWKLDNLIIIYDSNDITLDAALKITQSDNVEKRFSSYNFDVISVDGHNIRAICDAYKISRANKNGKPKIIIAKTTIGKGIDEVAGTHKAHGESGIKFAAQAKDKLRLPAENFFVSDEARNFFSERNEELQKKYLEWEQNFSEWSKENPELLIEYQAMTAHNFDAIDFFAKHPTFDKAASTRAAFGSVLNAYAKEHKNFLTGSADLFGSTKNYLTDCGDFSAETNTGRNFYFGIREHAMAGISNGIAYDGFFDISCATFLAFSDYLRPSIRVAALAGLPVKYIFTHDSVAVGEDGPTHQPAEIIAALRCIPNMDVVRPSDAEECVGAMALAAINSKRPTTIILSRQDLPLLEEITDRRNGVLYGGYVALREKIKLHCIILSCGSELQLAIAAAKNRDDVRVVSMPCMECFERQSDNYKESVFPKTCKKRIAIEAGIGMPWQKYVGTDGKIISIETFGFSAPGNEVLEHFGMSVENLQGLISSL